MDSTPWILCGNFNITINPLDRNTTPTDWRTPLRFSQLISSRGLLNLTLHGRHFTWSNERYDLTMARLDRFLISTDWNLRFPSSTQKALPNTSSDHCPIMLIAKKGFRKTKFFRFENLWLRFPALEKVVLQAWSSMHLASTPLQLHLKLQNLQREIKLWAVQNVGIIKQHVEACREYLGWIDRVKEHRRVTDLEKFIAALIKKRYTDLSVIEEDMWKQRSKVNWELQGDKGTRFFHARASSNKNHNAIPQIEFQGVMHSDQKAKNEAFFQHFLALMGAQSKDMPSIYWSNLYQQGQNLVNLGDQIQMKEIKEVINRWPNNKSPSPDGFTGEFYKKFMHILTPDIHSILDMVMRQTISLHPLKHLIHCSNPKERKCE